MPEYREGDVVNGYQWDGRQWVLFQPPPPVGAAPTLTPGTGAYAGMMWDGKQWVGASPAQGRRNGMGVASLVIGICAVLLCGGGFIGPILAITFGWTGMKRAKQGLATNGGVAKAGFILGWVAAGIGLILAVVYGVALLTRQNTLNTFALEQDLRSALAGEFGGDYSVDCPSEVPFKAGSMFTCTAVSLVNGTTSTILVVQEDEAGNLTWEVQSVR